MNTYFMPDIVLSNKNPNYKSREFQNLLDVSIKSKFVF